MKISWVIAPAVAAMAIPEKGTLDMLRPNFDITEAVPIIKAAITGKSKSVSLICDFGLNHDRAMTPETISRVPMPILAFISSPRKIIARIVLKKGAVAINEEVMEIPAFLKLSNVNMADKPGASIPAITKKGNAFAEGMVLSAKSTIIHITNAAVEKVIIELRAYGFRCIPIFIMSMLKPNITAENRAISTGSIRKRENSLYL